MPTARMGMTHLNNNLMCVIDCETTGDIPGHHDIYQICLLPLNADLKPFKEIVPFYCDIQLKRPENADEAVYKKYKDRICNAQINGLEAYRAADLFDEWFQKLNLGYNKQIIPLAQNWVFDRGFLIDWLGIESFKQYFSVLYRDTMTASLFLNDQADHHNDPVPFAKNNLQWLCKTLNIPHERAHDALQDCLVTAEVYRQMCKACTWYNMKPVAPELPEKIPD